MRSTISFIVALITLCLTPACQIQAQQKQLIVVVGAQGESEYGEQFNQWASQWETAANSEYRVTSIGVSSQEASDRQQLTDKLAEIAQSTNTSEVWLILIGHGTFDGKIAKFNLKGRDISAQELKGWLDPIKIPTVVINCSSCSSPFLRELQAPHRTVVVATKSGYQYNFARFGKYLAESIVDETIDLDKDGQTSLLESFIAASTAVQEFYDADGRLATELALLDDNGDALGTPADWFSGIRTVKRAKGGGHPDGPRANQIFLVQRPGGVVLNEDELTKRNALEMQLEALRQKKSQLTTDDYYRQLEEIMVKLAKLYRTSKARNSR